MDAKDIDTQKKVDLLGSLAKEDTSEVQQSLKRELDSVDDFEHLGHDISPLKEMSKVADSVVGSADHTREFVGEINKGVDSAEKVASSLADGANFDPLRKDRLFDKASTVAMDSNLLDLANTFPDRKEADAKLDKFLSEKSPLTEKQLKENIKEKIEDVKTASQNFMDMERGPISYEPPKETLHETSSNDIIEKFTDSEPEDDFKPSFKEDLSKIKDNDNVKMDMFKDVDDFEYPKASAPVLEPQKVQESKNIIDSVKIPEVAPVPKLPEVPVTKLPEPIKAPEPKKPEPFVAPVKEPVKAEPIKSVLEPATKKELDAKKKEEIPIKPEPKPKTQAEAMFCKMGLDAWFIPEKLNPKVADLIYWRDPKKSGPVFAGVLIVLLALTYFSLISVVAYLSLLGLTGTISFRIYKNVVQAVQKTGDGHPFKELLDTDLSLPQNKVEEISKVGVAHFNAAIVELRRLFLVEDLVDSIKFGVLLWCLTYLGAWFNGMTLIIIAWVALFTFPKVYETNKTQIDANLDIVRNKLEEITSKVKAAIPIGKKVEDKKQQ